MGRLEGPELANLEEHLLQCEECQQALQTIDLFRQSIREASEHLKQEGGRLPAAPVPPRFDGEYMLVQAALPNTEVENIGILLVDAASGRLHCRFRRDFEEFGGEDVEWFEQLPDAVSNVAMELGAEKCLEWIESTLSNAVRISTRNHVLIEDYGTTLDGLYAKHVRPKVLRFRTHLPQYSLEAAAGRFGKQMAVEPEGWVEIRTDIALTDDMFVTHIKGHSMELDIPDGSLGAFRSKIEGTWEDKVLLIEQYGESGGNRYTVKRVHVSKNVDPNEPGDGAWLHERVTLESSNPAYGSWDVASAGKIRALGEFLFIV